MNRRSFLKRAALLGGALSLGPMAFSKVLATESKSLAKSGSSVLRLSFVPYKLQLRHAFNLARSSRNSTPDVLVRIDYDGVSGYGEASMPPYLGESVNSVSSFLRRVDLSRVNDPFRIADIHEYMEGIASGNKAAKAAVDIALHDLTGKLMGQPWYRIWGLNRDKAPATSYTIGIDTPEIVRTKVAEASDYKVLKVKMGLDNDRETVETIRSMTDTPICVDVNQGWKSKEEALEMCYWLSERGCLFVEQPFDKRWIDETAWLRERSPLPIIADEFVQGLDDIGRAAGVYDGVNIKLMKCGGLYEAKQMAEVARAMGMKVMLGCMTETSCAVSAAAQLASLADWADLDGNLLISNDPFEGVKVENGMIRVPRDRAGVGIVKVSAIEGLD